jgi:hypothetical protein
MTKPREPNQIRDDAIVRFIEIAVPKFDKGQEEHGGNLDERASFEDLEDEIVDLFFYLQSLKHKITKAQENGD